MIDSVVLQSAHDNLDERSKAVLKVVGEDVQTFTLPLAEIHAMEPPEGFARFRIVHPSTLKRDVIYALFASSADVATAISAAFEAARSTANREYALPRSNGSTSCTHCIYVGRSRNIQRRLREHLIKASQRTYALNMSRWIPRNLPGTITVTIQGLRGEVSDACFQDVEDALWNLHQPMFGRRGAR